MIEELTPENLRKIGFDTEAISRLKNWKDYECFHINGRGKFFASNKDMKIYSGKDAEEKQTNKSIFSSLNSEEMKTKFKTFEELFDYALSAESITIPESKLKDKGEKMSEEQKAARLAAMRRNSELFAKSEHSLNFGYWLQEFRNWEYGDEKAYIENLTRQNWLEYLAHRENEKERIKERFEEIKAAWKPEILSLKQAETKTEQETPTFTNNFDKINPTEIYKHFKAGLVEKGYLTEQELNEYLKAAFELKTIPETLFKIKDSPKKSVIEAVFYKYYKNVAGKIHRKQKQYAALLGDYFEGYKTSTVSSNFSKSVY
jgi:hypothetical protein